MEQPPIAIQFKTLPTDPGVYQYFDKNDTVIYVGKAKNLKRRVTSYFTKVHDNAKTRILVKKIHRMEHIVVPTEVDALLLENNLIKKYRPRYNILLKDDKTYPWICVKKEAFPRIFSTRKVIRDGSEYFGPYPNVKTVYTLLELIRGLYPIRTCNYDLSEEKIQKQSYKVCLEYHIGNCLAPCESKVREEEYNQNIAAIRDIIKGNFRRSLDQFKTQMKQYASAMEFERAQEIKEKLESLENYQAKSTVVNSKITNVDVFTIISDESYGYVNFFQVAFGSIIRSHTVEIKKKLEETDAEMLPLAIVDLRQRFNSQSKEIYLPFEVDLGPKIKVTVPKLGDKKKLVELSQRNAKFFRLERFKQMKIVDPERHIKRLMQQMKTDLRLQDEPVHIECFDNSNIQGTNPTAACVVFRNGKPFKKDYRHFKIKTVEGPDDFASMEEVVHRRYKRLSDEGQSLPQLIVIDGGKGQLSSAVKSLNRLGLRGQIAIIGIAKRLEEIYYPGDSIPMYLDKKSETLKVIQQLRNEAHRFGLTLHRNIRSKNALKSPLDEVEGIGPKTKEMLLKRFKSLKRIKGAPEAEIIELLGEVKGVKIFQKLQKL
ncbi:MAG: excinuclease ABC subunit UvrC [Flavobacteriaceae bacterium]|jgi:excinuclease ABC subunit C|nr:excinuclease ABC subunit UvrC [Flavobacteriaceae bacterium]MDG1942057.1 excinuclease ABC subunit UvrC [Flavobacteriaceae bacterium]|tara:strand:+ start:461 stop:2254 length:1794 start_codon:yes stop_codon:yes gene_type:complete